MVVLARKRCGGTGALYTSASFSGQSDFASQKSCVCAVTPRHKIRLSYCREKAFVATLCRTAEYAANPFPASDGSKGITH